MNDPPWDTPEFKQLIKRRPQAFIIGGSRKLQLLPEHCYRNHKVFLLKRNSFVANFIETKVNHLKESLTFGSEHLLSKLEKFQTDSLFPQELSNKTNGASLESMKDFKCQEGVPSEYEFDGKLHVSECEVINSL